MRSIGNKFNLVAISSIIAMMAALLSGPAAVSAASGTAQGIMVNLNAAGSFSVNQTNTYKFNADTAATYFTNLWNGVDPTITCNGSPTNCANPAPKAPTAPAPDFTKVNSDATPPGVCQTQKCTFLDGGTLDGSTYTQSVQVVVGSGSTKRTYTYTYTYVITPPINPVDPYTAWDLVDTTGSGTAHIAINGTIAGESVVKSSNPKVGTKFSFSLLESDGSNRVQNLVVTVDGVPYATDSVVNYPVDFAYTTNAGSNGTTSLLVNGDARTILNMDSFAGNNDGGADGSALALATLNAVGVDLAPGDHTVTLAGTVKGNSASSDIGFSVTQTIHVITLGCSGQQ